MLIFFGSQFVLNDFMYEMSFNQKYYTEFSYLNEAVQRGRSFKTGIKGGKGDRVPISSRDAHVAPQRPIHAVNISQCTGHTDNDNDEKRMSYLHPGGL